MIKVPLVASLLGVAGLASAGEPGGTVIPMPLALTEAEACVQIGAGAMSSCLVASAKFRGVDFCTITVFPMMCFRWDHNVPMSINEASDIQGGLGYIGVTQVAHMQVMNARVSPAETRNPVRVGDLVTASASTQGRIAPIPLGAVAFEKILAWVTFGNYCHPLFAMTRVPYGYTFASEGDHLNGTEFGNWRGVISFYWFIPWLMPLTAVSTAMDVASLCPIDFYRIFCYGSNGTRYPSTGTNPFPSRALNMTDSVQDGFNPTSAPLFTYGPLHVLPGSAITVAAHSPRSYTYGAAAMYAAIQRGAYLQPLYPERYGFCIDTYTADVNPLNKVLPAQALSTPITEAAHVDVQDQNRAVTALFWPRFTCCNYCALSNDAAGRMWAVGLGFLPQLINF